MRVDNLVLRSAIAEAQHRWEVARRRPSGPLVQPASPGEDSPVAILAKAAYCVMERQPDGVGRVIETCPWARDFSTAMNALRASVDACLPDSLQATDFHPLTLRGALGEPYLLGSRSGMMREGQVTPGGAQRHRS